MRWLFVVLAVLFGLEGRALACMNATISDSESVRKLRDAEAALEDGDVRTARELASDVTTILSWRAGDDPGRNGFLSRGMRIEALSYTRDPLATEAEREQAVRILENYSEGRKQLGQTTRDPAFLADYGEALERAGHDQAAYDMLLPLYDRDLIGSAYAYAALARLARAKNQSDVATNAIVRCERMAVNPRACRGEYPPQPFLRGRPFDFFLPGLAFLGVALVRLVRRPTKPWTTYRPYALGAVVDLIGVTAFLLANERLGVVATAFAIALGVGLAWAQRAFFFSAARSAPTNGYRLRAATEEDDITRVPIVRTIGHPKQIEVLEQLGEAGYRENARPTLVLQLRGREALKAGTVVVVALLMFVSLAASAFWLLGRGR